MNDFLTRPLSHWAQRTSKDIARDACAIHAFKRRMPASEKCLYIVGVIGVIAAIAFNNFGA